MDVDVEMVWMCTYVKVYIQYMRMDKIKTDYTRQKGLYITYRT